MTKTNYKTPSELVGDGGIRLPLSTRIKKDTKLVLTKAAKEQNRTIGALAAAVLDDYADWLSKQGKR